MLFAKQPAEINVINDLNGEIVNFYRTAVSDFNALACEIGKTLHSREQMNVAKFIYNPPDYFSNVQRAWAVWAMSKLCFSSDFTGSFSLCRKGKSQTVHSIGRGKNNFTSALKSLLKRCTIEQDDALNVIRQYDSEGAFHYLAPPYANCNMGHYENMFGEENLRQLLGEIARHYGHRIETCAEATDLAEFGIEHGACIAMPRPNVQICGLIRQACRSIRCSIDARSLRSKSST